MAVSQIHFLRIGWLIFFKAIYNTYIIMNEKPFMVIKQIGAFAVPEIIHWVPGLPKTRSGKVMRRILRKIASGDTSTLVSNK